MDEKNSIGVFVTLLGLTICLVFRLMITRLESELQIEDKLLDYELISIDDYTVNGYISQRFYNDVIEATDKTCGGEPMTPEEAKEQVPLQRFAKFLIE